MVVNKRTLKQLKDLETEERFVQKTKAGGKTTTAKKKTAKIAGVKIKKDSIKTAEKAVFKAENAEEKQDASKKAELDEAAIDAAALEWAMTVIKHNLTRDWIEEE